MTSSIQSGAIGRDEDELTRLRRRVVADGYSSAHSCQHCEEIVIIPWDVSDGEVFTFMEETAVLATEEEMRQHAAAGCKFWSMVSDEVDYVALVEKRARFDAGEPGSVALSDDEAQALDRLRCRSKNRFTSRDRSRRSVAETCVNYVELSFFYTLDKLIARSANVRMEITVHENGFKHFINIELTVFALPGGPQVSIDRYALVCPPNIDPGSAQSFQLIRTWMQKCALEHRCDISDHNPSSMPTMLLSLDQVDTCGVVRLIESKRGEKQRYLALSYCWGHGQKKLLNTTTLGEYSRDGIRLADLDATIQDAIRVTVNLGYLYLWVDALCIIQDNSELRDSEIGRMDSIYENASITIVASRASSVSQGFLTQRQPVGARTPDHVFSVAYKASKEQNSVQKNAVVLVPEEDEVERPRLEPWESRAWTLQEDLLSKRQLRFGTRQTSWVCYCSEDIYEDFDGWVWADLKHASKLGLSHRQVGRLATVLRRPDDLFESFGVVRKYWYNVVETYSQRALTFEEDRLPALSAVSRRMARILGDEYWCGIWRSEAPWELLWAHGLFRQAADATRTQGADNSGRWGPSWSWASQQGSIRFAMGKERHHFKVDANFEIVEHVAKYKSPRHIYGAVTAARLRVRGLIRPAPFGLQECRAMDRWASRTEEWTTPFEEGPDGELLRFFVEQGAVFPDRSTLELLADPKCSLKSKQILLLLVGYNCLDTFGGSGPLGLMLLDEGGNEFSRLGTFKLCLYPYHIGPWFPEVRTTNEQIEEFVKIWGGKSSLKEIVLI